MFVRIHDFKQVKSIHQCHKKVKARNNKIQMILFPYQKDHIIAQKMSTCFVS